MPRVMVSGGFDPLHEGHVECISRAAEHGEVIAVVNSDAWLKRKKGYVFQTFEARCAIVAGLRGVSAAVPVDDTDGSVCAAIIEHRPAYFANGGDRGSTNTPEVALCESLGIGLLFGLGSKVQSSSALVERSWGHYEVLHSGDGFRVKLLTLAPGKATSLQRHQHRAEHWIYADGRYRYIACGAEHKLRNDTDKPLTVVEVWTGDKMDEDDIERLVERAHGA